MNKIIIPMGYMGSGSSAITDLISEFEGYDINNGSFEYVFLHCPNGLFDLEDKLLVGNNAVRSDEAIHSFRNMMNDLYSKKLWWPANYKKNLSPDFMKITEEFLGEIIQYEPDDFWYMQEKLDAGMFIKMCVRKAVRILTRDKVMLKKPLSYSPMQLSFIDAESFYAASRKYLNSLFEEMGLQEHHLVLDQLLLPYNLYRMENYFGEEAECFVIDRDPRDVYISNKYVWAKMGVVVPYPTNPEQFCVYYRRMREQERPTDNPHVHRFHFEDLIYRYEESVDRVCDNLGLDKDMHKHQKTSFVPERSIQNTQLFNYPEYREEMKIIEAQLKEFLYDFPYARDVDMGQVF